MTAKVMVRILASKRSAQEFDVEKLHLIIYDVEDRGQNQVNILMRSTDLVNWDHNV
jgi:hypothetical protein